MYSIAYNNYSITNWENASLISSNVKTTLKKDKNILHENLIMLNLPDNVRGAYLYRDLCFIEALKCYKIKKEFKKVLIISTHPVMSMTDNIYGEIHNKEIIMKNLPEDIYIKDHMTILYSIKKTYSNSFTVRFSDRILDNSSIYYYSSGNIHLLKYH